MIPNDCLIVKPKEGVSPFTHLTWNSNGCPKTIPFDIYELNKERLDVLEDPNNFIHDFYEESLEPEEKPKEEKKSSEKVKKSGVGKNKKR